MSVNESFKVLSWIISFIFISCILMSTGAYLNDYFTKEEKQKKQDLLFKTIEDSISEQMYARTICNWKNIDYWINHFNIKEKIIVKGQIILECGWELNSRKVRQDNNLFGMKKAENRITTCDYIINGHAGYSTFMRSIKDYFLWQEQNYKGGDYYKFLERAGYANDSSYIYKLRLIVNKLKKDTL